jgi:hypothetical protein
VTSAIELNGPVLNLDETLLPSFAGGPVLVGYSATALVLALRITPTRDVL